MWLMSQPATSASMSQNFAGYAVLQDAHLGSPSGSGDLVNECDVVRPLAAQS